MIGKIIFWSLAAIFSFSALSILWQINNFFIVEIPDRGGRIVEGSVGLPRYINPVLAVTDGDEDITKLVFAGLLKHSPDGLMIPDLAEEYSVSPDGKIYTVTIKPDVRFHDDTTLTAEDVAFTVAEVQNPAHKSPKRADWEGVIIEIVNARTIRFVLAEPYAPFVENLTLGILPKNAWKDVSEESFALSDLNSSPIGAGAYKLKSIKKNSSGIPFQYELTANNAYALGAPKISSIVFKFFPTEKALREAYIKKEIDSINSVSAETAMELKKHGAIIHTVELPRVFGVFFNSNTQEIFAEPSVRRALDMSVNRAYIVSTVLQGFGTELTGPVPPSFVGDSLSFIVATSTSPESRVAEANALLEKAGWKMNGNGIREKKTIRGTTTLAFSISTSDAEELKSVGEILKSEWKKIGADVSIKVFEGGQLNQNVIRPRKYDALLFGQIVNRDLDLFAFWHSSQREDPGLNIASYSNPKVDKILETLRTASDRNVRLVEYQKFEAEFLNDKPAVFLYAPDLIYIIPPHVKNMSLKNVADPSDRFDNINAWHINTERVWRIFAR